MEHIDKKEAVSRWTSNRFLLRSGYYAGRPPQSSDLNSKMLEQIYQGILKDIGQKQATNFVRFVNNLKDLSASSFIVAFERFWNSDFANTSVTQEKGDRVALSGRGRQLEVEGMCAIITTLTHKTSDRQDFWMSSTIKQEFILKHASEIPKKERSKDFLPFPGVKISI